MFFGLGMNEACKLFWLLTLSNTNIGYKEKGKEKGKQKNCGYIITFLSQFFLPIIVSFVDAVQTRVTYERLYDFPNSQGIVDMRINVQYAQIVTRPCLIC